jgi:hypothetical protein
MEQVREETLTMLMGKMMALIQGRRVAEDDEHTEVSTPKVLRAGEQPLIGSQYDTSDSEVSVKQFLFRDGEAPIRQVERGFAAETVRDPEGAVDYVAAKEGWEEFVQRVRMGRLNEEVAPTETEIAPTELTDEHALRICAKGAFESIIEAAHHIHEQETTGKIVSYDGAADGPLPSRALSILADAALESVPSHLPMMRTDPSAHHRALLPQPSHAHTGGLPAFILPRPTPTQQPRRLLPARQQMGLGMGLPDPFAMNGPPQLPPPPGSNFARLPLPGYLPQGHAPSLYFPPPPPGSHPAAPPRRY